MAEPLRLKARAQAPLPAVRAALTDPTALRTWLAEHAEVALPRTFEFWGRSTPEGDAPHQRLLHADDRVLRFSWLIGGEDTTVEITLAEESAETTTVSLSQWHVPTAARGVLRAFWALAVANLVDHVEGRDLTPMCDYTAAELRVDLFIGASPEEVYRSLTDPEVFGTWFGAGRFLSLEPGRRVQVEWTGGVVDRWELAASGGGTKVALVRGGFDEPDHGAWSGWLGGIAELRRYHELTTWRPVRQAVEPDGLLTT